MGKRGPKKGLGKYGDKMLFARVRDETIAKLGAIDEKTVSHHVRKAVDHYLESREKGRRGSHK